MTQNYPRDLAGYGPRPPDPQWPGGARIAVQVVLNYEEGGENCVLHGDPASESFLSEMVGVDARAGVRHMSMESLYEYGTRVGVWRLRRVFDAYQVPVTVFAVGMAVERYPDPVRCLHADGHEICSHGYRWIDYQHVDEATERAHLQAAVAAIESAVGERPLGWYTGRSGPNTRRLVVEAGGFSYDADDYSDELPFWNYEFGRPHLVVPYTMDVNDMRFATLQGFNNGEHFYQYLKDSFDVLYAEGATRPRMLSVGLHCRLAGRPGRFAALERFIRYVRSHDRASTVVRLDDPELFRHPVAYIVEVGRWNPTEREIASLGEYLMKGGFLIVDDFQGQRALANLYTHLLRALPDSELLRVQDDHPVFDTFFRIVPEQVIPPYGRYPPDWLGIFEDNDPTGRLMVMINANNDIAEYWEFSDRGYYPIDLSNEAYKLGVNYVVYGLTR